MGPAVRPAASAPSCSSARMGSVCACARGGLAPKQAMSACAEPSEEGALGGEGLCAGTCCCCALSHAAGTSCAGDALQLHAPGPVQCMQ